ncbi:MAG: hypothetical protein JKY42_09685, partial [Flavobacteriales bacterium]|nr:hypothetical protein [Flavobacteriales bacterium]
MLKSIDIGKAIIELHEDTVIIIRFKSGVEFLLEDAILTDKAYEKLCAGKPYKTLVDGRNIFGIISNKARQHFADNKLFLLFQISLPIFQ